MSERQRPEPERVTRAVTSPGDVINRWFAAGKGVISQGIGRMLRPGYWANKPTAGVDFKGALLVSSDGAWVCQPFGAGYRWEKLGNVLTALTDPGADRIVFWDESENAWAFLTVGTGLLITTTTLSATYSAQLATIASGVITLTDSAVRVVIIDTEASGPTDDLDTISGGTEGQIICFNTTNSARDVTLKDGTGNLRLAGDVLLDNNNDAVCLSYAAPGPVWRQVSPVSDNA